MPVMDGLLTLCAGFNILFHSVDICLVLFYWGRRLQAFDLFSFPSQSILQNLDMLTKRLLESLAGPSIALKFTNSRLHFRPFDLPSIPVPFMSMPFGL